jgi:hypothetical protein
VAPTRSPSSIDRFTRVQTDAYVLRRRHRFGVRGKGPLQNHGALLKIPPCHEGVSTGGWGLIKVTSPPWQCWVFATLRPRRCLILAEQCAINQHSRVLNRVHAPLATPCTPLKVEDVALHTTLHRHRPRVSCHLINHRIEAIVIVVGVVVEGDEPLCTGRPRER